MCIYINVHIILCICIFNVFGLFLKDIQNCVRSQRLTCPKGPNQAHAAVLDLPSQCVNGEFMDDKSNI